MAGLVVEVEAVAVEPEEGVGNRRQHRAVMRVGHAQAHDGVAGAQHVQHAVAEDGPVDRLRDEIGGAHFVGVGEAGACEREEVATRGRAGGGTEGGDGRQRGGAVGERV